MNALITTVTGTERRPQGARTPVQRIGNDGKKEHPITFSDRKSNHVPLSTTELTVFLLRAKWPAHLGNSYDNTFLSFGAQCKVMQRKSCNYISTPPYLLDFDSCFTCIDSGCFLWGIPTSELSSGGPESTMWLTVYLRGRFCCRRSLSGTGAGVRIPFTTEDITVALLFIITVLKSDLNLSLIKFCLDGRMTIYWDSSFDEVSAYILMS